MYKITVISTFFIVSVLLFSCNKKSDTPQPAVTQTTSPGGTPVITQQNYPEPTVKIGLSVEVLPSTASSARLEGLTGALVTVKQNGAVYSTTTDETGIATFSNLIEGSASIYVSKQGLLSFNTSVDLQYNGTPVVNGTSGNAPSGNVTVSNTQNSSSRVSIILPRIGTSVEGILRADTDGSGAGTTNILSSGTVNLIISNSYSPNVFTATVNNGQFAFTNLPEGVPYTLQTSADIFGTEPASGNIPSYKFNLNFPAATRVTPLIGNKSYLGIIVLN